MRSCGVCTPASAGVEEEIEEANGIAVAYAPTIIKSYFLTFALYILCLKNFSSRFLIYFEKCSIVSNLVPHT